jgi:phosphinothricin acetyltransferase
MKGALTWVDAMRAGDWPSVSAIYEEGLATRNASFETDLPGWPAWDEHHLPVCRLVARSDGQVLAWAALSAVSRRAVYAGVAEASTYVAAAARQRGIGTLLLSALVAASERQGFWMLQASIFPENGASLRLHRRCGFREVGVRRRIAQLDGVWRDTILLERRSSVVGV